MEFFLVGTLTCSIILLSVALIAFTRSNRRFRAEQRVTHDLSERKRSERLVNYILNASRILESSLDDEQLHQDLVNFVVEEISQACTIFVRQENQLHRMASAASNSVVGSAMEAIEEDKPVVLQLEQVMATGRSSLLPGTGPPGIRTCALVPLTARGGVVGVLVVGSSEENAFGEDDISMLEELGRRAGIALENARLYKHAYEANRLKDEFVAIVSHELRTPLTPILGAVYMLRNERYDEKIFNRALDLIERNAKAQAKIVEDLLDLSRILSGKLRLNWEFVDMGSVIHAAIETVRPASEAKGIQIETCLNPVKNAIRGDTDRLQQVIWNLLANSVKFTPKGGRITIELEESATYAEIRVIDTGIGIGPEFLPYVFERFRQENATRTRVHGGLGLGLAIVRHLVESHGGTVLAQSSGDKQGSTFVVRLPVRTVHETARTAHVGD
jgi:signal transduction histidine kinase